MSITQIPPVPQVDTERFRQILAGLIDPQEKSVAESQQYKDLAVKFCALLPAVFGAELDRLTLWNRIASAIQTAHAKTVGDDTDFFVAVVLEHIKADHSATSASPALAECLETLAGWGGIERKQWMTYLNTHLTPVLVYARKAWKDSLGGARS